MELVEVYSVNEVILAYQVADLLALYPEKSKFLIILNDLSSLEKLAANLNFFLQDTIISTYLPWDVLPYDTVSPTVNVTANRLSSLYFLQQKNKQFILTTPEALLQKTFCPQYFSSQILQLHLEKSLAIESLVEHLESCGYQRTSLVEEIGQYTLRGSVVDFFPAHSQEAIRVEFYLDRIHSLRSFATESQRSLKQLTEFEIFPIKELVLPELKNDLEKETIFRRIKEALLEQDLPLSLYKTIEDSLKNNLIFPGIEFIQSFWFQKSAFSAFLTESCVAVVVKKDLLKEQILDFENFIQERLEIAEVRENLRTPQSDNYLSSKELLDSWIFKDQILIKNKKSISPLIKLAANLLAAKHTDSPLKPLAEEIRSKQKEGYRTAFVLSNARRLKPLKEILATYEIEVEEISENFFAWEKKKTPSSELAVFFAELEHGFSDQEKRLLLISERDIFPDQSISRKKAKGSKIRKFLGTLSQLKENDFIVHIDHGVGIYRGLRQFDVEGKIGDFLYLEYAEGAKLYLPVENIGKLQKYAGASANKTPALTKLGGKVWNTTKAKVKENVAELAGQLLKLIAQRETSEGLRFEPYNEEDREFAGTFNYSETADQAKAITDVLDDLSKSKPMDRLVCGDVGYGKTEVAIRAAYKAVQSGYQVAILVPTTILADQHYQTFSQRFADSPIRVAILSRFKSPEQNKEALTALALGQIDIVIGTHRLIQKDISFKNLGLLIIDEEHRFGVAHKEKLKRLRTDVHVLTLSATPIPRTLHQSLVGIRDLSLIETPPVNRQLIKTFIAQYSESIVKEAIQREISRGGQVFYIYNRVDNISLIADQLSTFVPGARIVYGHGQMKEHELEKIMHKFVNGEIDVLVSTTIIESGLDIPNANTIIIRNAERFGLAELYQLRGRVGRSSRRAYAYLLIPDPKTLNADAKKRIDILRSLDDLGIGFRLALQDMEIRGAGNLLGKDQSGHVDLVGYELYSRILKEAIDELKRAQRKVSEIERKNIPQVDPEMRIGFPAHLPEFYVPDVSERLILYQRLIDINGEEEALAFFEEIEDRFGSAPIEVTILIELMLFRSLLKNYAILTANYSAGVLSFSFHPEASPTTENLFNSLQQFKDLLKISPSMVFSLRLMEKEINSPKKLYLELKEILRSLFA